MTWPTGRKPTDPSTSNSETLRSLVQALWSRRSASRCCARNGSWPAWTAARLRASNSSGLSAASSSTV